MDQVPQVHLLQQDHDPVDQDTHKGKIVRKGLWMDGSRERKEHPIILEYDSLSNRSIEVIPFFQLVHNFGVTLVCAEWIINDVNPAGA